MGLLPDTFCRDTYSVDTFLLMITLFEVLPARGVESVVRFSSLASQRHMVFVCLVGISVQGSSKVDGVKVVFYRTLDL